MTKFKSLAALAAVLAAFAGAGAFAVQYNALGPSVTGYFTMGQTDVVPYIPGGAGGVPSKYTYPGLLGAMDYYQLSVPVTAFNITPNPGISLLFLNPAGTLATGTINMPPAPNDGSRFCIYDTQIQTAVTIAASPGQSLAGTTLTALAANTQYCWRWMAPLATWYRTV